MTARVDDLQFFHREGRNIGARDFVVFSGQLVVEVEGTQPGPGLTTEFDRRVVAGNVTPSGTLQIDVAPGTEIRELHPVNAFGEPGS